MRTNINQWLQSRIVGRDPIEGEAAVYVLVDEHKIPFYTGSTIQPLQLRLHQHMNRGYIKINCCNLVVVEYVDSSEQFEAEQRLFDSLLKKGINLMTNRPESATGSVGGRKHNEHPCKKC